MADKATGRAPAAANVIIQWIKWADDDYIGARQLLLGDLLVNGAVLSNTAVEKYLKAIFLVRGIGIPKGFAGHNVPALYQNLKSAGLILPLSEDYLNLLFKAYQLRYPDDLPVDFNIAIDRTRLLTELDYTVSEIRKGFTLQGTAGPIQTKLDLLLSRRDPRLLEKNCHFGTTKRSDLFRENAARFTMRALGAYNFVTAEYQTAGVPDTRNFKVEGIKVTVTGNRMDGKLPLE